MDLQKRLANWRSFLFPTLSVRSLLSHYVPMAGAVSHSLYSVHIFSPHLISRLFTYNDLAAECVLLSTATVGPGFYIYFRPHMHLLRTWDRVQYSVFASIMFTYGSLFSAVLIKDLLPSRVNTWFKSAIAIGLSWFLLSRGFNYLKLLDNRRTKVASSNPTIGVASSEQQVVS